MPLANIVFVLIKDKQVTTAQTVPVEKEVEISRRLAQFNYTGVEACVAVFGEGAKWDIRFPLTESEIDKTAAKLFRNL